jgi:integrase
MPRRNQGPRLRWLDKRQCFYITWTENGRSRERSTGTPDRKRAEIVLGEFLHARGRKDGPSDPSEMLVTDVLAYYAIGRGPMVTAPEAMARGIEVLTGFWEGRVVSDVRPETCRRYCEKRARSAATMRRELAVLQAAINYAQRNGKLTRSVAVALPENPPSRDRWLTRQEAARLVRASRTEQARLYMPLFILLGLYTGRRKQAILSLRWPQVDLEARVIDFESPGRERTKKRRGKVPIPAKLLPLLRRTRKRGSDLGYVLHINGKRIGNIKKGFAAACRRAGLKGVSPHTLRHTAATWIVQAGVPLWQAAGYLAMRQETLERVYGHHHPDFMREAAEAMNRRAPSVRGTSA